MPTTTETAARPAALPARAVMQRYSRDLFSLPDLYSVSWGRNAPEQLTLRFGNESARALADALLRDQVAGVQLVLAAINDDTTGGSGTVPPVHEWWPNVAKAGAALPGIVDHDRRGSAVMYWTDSQERTEHLSALINDAIGPAKVYYSDKRRPDRWPREGADSRA